MARRGMAGDALAAASANAPQAIPVGPDISAASLFPGLRPRHDGWTQERTQRFLDTLAHTGCVKDAARVAGMSTVGARRMKARFPLFSAAWEDALARAQQGLIAIAYRRAVEGKETVIIRRGEEYERRIAPSDAILGLLLKRGDMAGGGGLHNAEDVITREEFAAGWRFDDWGKKYKPESSGARERVLAKIDAMRARYQAMVEEEAES
jgi:hypothetical protein